MRPHVLFTGIAAAAAATAGCRPVIDIPRARDALPPIATTAGPPPDAPPEPAPGVTIDGDRATFVVRSHAAERIEVWIYAEPMDADAVLRIPLARAGESHAASVSLAELYDLGATDPWYGLRAWGPGWRWDPAWTPGSELGFTADVDPSGARFDPNKLLWDPYARELSHDPSNATHADWSVYAAGEHRAVDSAPMAPKAWVPLNDADADADLGPRPVRLLTDEVVYEAHVRALTMLDPDVPEALRGTYAGAALAAPRLAALGITAVELLPVHETNNDQNDLSDDASGDNYWGYASLAFFAPDRRYAADRSPGGPTAEFQAMAKAFHDAGLALYVDVVYNHTGEGGSLLSLRGLDNAGYYELDGADGYRSDNGVGPNLNAADPLARDLVIDSLRYWRDEMGVDGFRFDLAPILGNGCAASCFAWDPTDPDGILARAANEIGGPLIAEPWGVTGDTYRGGQFPPGWSEWNDAYRDAVRSDQNQLGVADVTPAALVEALSGSPGRYGDDGRGPSASVAYVVSHDGFTLADQYRCNAKDNDQPWPYGPSSGGADDNRSWDQGGDPVAQRRAARTGLAWTLVSAGVPMFTAGDEWLRSQRCNNNPYNLDSVATWVDWAERAADPDAAVFEAFARGMLAFRAAHPALRPASWRTSDQVRWYEPDGTVADGAYLADPTRHALAMYLDGATAGDPANALLVLVNGWSDGVTFTLPPAPSGARWRIAADTHEWLLGDHNVFDPGDEPALPDDAYLLGQRAIAVLIDP